ncbi:hypothetical protein QL285_063026 [Trifolium repens]|nr:hypothetical protein QL285_063026 [Trifolium repens]
MIILQSASVMSFNPHSSFHSLPRLLPFPTLEFLCMTITSVESSFGLEKRELQPLYVLSNSREWFCSEFLRIKSWLLPTEHFMQPATARLASRSTRHGELACLRGPSGVLRHPAKTCCGDLRHPARTCGALLMLAASLQQGAASLS